MSNSPATICTWLGDPMPKDVARSIQRLAEADDVRRLAIMPDVHLAHGVCIGTVVATTSLVYPEAIGGDIGCGMAALAIDASADLLGDEQTAARILAGLYRSVPTNRHSKETMPSSLPDDLRQRKLSRDSLEKLKGREARVQLGTLGRGNHFLELQADQKGQLWLMVHSGSRAMGQAITKAHLDRAPNKSRGLRSFDSESDLGQAYLHDVRWALDYAEENRLAMIRAVARMLQEQFQITPDWKSLIHGHHNHVRRERHFGQTFWVHRKGAQSAERDEPGIIPGSMGTASFHVRGRGCEAALRSSSHGAGRKLSRTEARKEISQRGLQRQMRSVWFDQRAASALRDEAPGAYKDIHAVLRAQKELVRKTRELRPLLSFKGH